jgi:hypothetical protein
LNSDGLQPSFASHDPRQVIITDIRVPFGSMVEFMVKWALASIPAMLILTVIGVVVFVLLLGVVGRPGAVRAP